MIAGHAPLAFAIAATTAAGLGVDRRRALRVGVLAGLFAVVPDVDVAYAVVGGLGALAAGPWVANEAFWDHAAVVHRGVTHSLAIGVPAVAGLGLSAGDSRGQRLAGVVLLGGLLAASLAVTGWLGSTMLLLYAVAGLGVVWLARRWAVGARTTLAAAAVGILTHPFGDLFTGTSPILLYPLDVRLLPERVVLLPDPTLNLLSIFGLELASIWVGVAVAASLLGVRVLDHVDRQALLGGGYGLAVLVLPAPTLDVSYHFVFGAVSVGSVGLPTLRQRLTVRTVSRGFLTGLAAVTIAVFSYAVGYVVL